MTPSETGSPAGASSPAAAEWRRVAGTFTDRVRGVSDWDAPAPVQGWVARDVVGHLVGWFPPFLASGTGMELSPGPSVDDDPVEAWLALADGVQALLEDPQAASRTFDHPRTGAMPLPQAVDQFFTSDVFMHTWDLARATGQDETLDAAKCAQMYAGMQPWDEALRASGHYGPKVDVPDDADPQTKLLGFIGRDPGSS